ncbi:hypothetical protein [Stenotrophomonas phage RAS14]
MFAATSSKVIDQWGDGRYGAVFWRTDRRDVWYCYDGHYSYQAVVDEFGNLICISHYTNEAGY